METKSEDTKTTIPFYPDHLRTEVRVMLWMAAVVLLIGAHGLTNPVGLGNPADPLDTPEHIKPEWYFLGVYQLLKFIPKTAGALLPVAAVALLVLWPFLDRTKDSKRQVMIRTIFSILFCLILIILTIWGGAS